MSKLLININGYSYCKLYNITNNIKNTTRLEFHQFVSFTIW